MSPGVVTLPSASEATSPAIPMSTPPCFLLPPEFGVFFQWMLAGVLAIRGPGLRSAITLYCASAPGSHIPGTPMAVQAGALGIGVSRQVSRWTRSQGIIPRGSRWKEQMSSTSSIAAPADASMRPTCAYAPRACAPWSPRGSTWRVAAVATCPATKT